MIIGTYPIFGGNTHYCIFFALLHVTLVVGALLYLFLHPEADMRTELPAEAG